MRNGWTTALTLAALTGLGLGTSACADSRALADAESRQTIDFVRAVREDIAAQIAYPNPAWKGPPAPYSGQRTDLAVTKYQTDAVKQPPSTSTSSGASGSSGGSQ